MGAEEGWVGIARVAAHLGVAKESIYRWVDSKGFPAHRVGRLLRFKLSEVDEWVKASGGDDSAPSPSRKTMGARPVSRKPAKKKT
jgi:excisionase family DNA binding protein